MDILRPRFDQTVGQSLHILDLTLPSLPVLIIVIAKHSGPRNAFLCHNLRELRQDRLGIPGCTLTIELITSENDKIRILRIDDS